MEDFWWTETFGSIGWFLDYAGKPRDFKRWVPEERRLIMTTRRTCIFLAAAGTTALCVAFIVVFNTPAAAAPGDTKWEYKVTTTQEMLVGANVWKKFSEAVGKKSADATDEDVAIVNEFYKEVMAASSVKFPHSIMQKHFNMLGAEGWELAGMSEKYMVFKRKK